MIFLYYVLLTKNMNAYFWSNNDENKAGNSEILKLLLKNVNNTKTKFAKNGLNISIYRYSLV